MGAPVNRLVRASPTVVRDRPSRPVSEVRLQLASDGSQDLFAAIVQQALRWLQARARAPLPEAAWRGGSFESEILGAQPVAAIRLDAPRPSWTAYLDDADRTVAQRRWITQVGVAQEGDGSISVGMRLVCVAGGEAQAYVPSIPGLVRQIVELGGATCEGRPLSTSPWVVRSPEDVDALIELLQSNARRFHVIVCSLPDDTGDLASAAVSVQDLHVRTLGAAHIVALTRAASFLLTNRIGKIYSVFDGAVRTYAAGLDLVQDVPTRHPVCFRTRIEAWTGGPAGFADFLIVQALLRSVQGTDQAQQFMSFAEAKRQHAQRELELQRAAGATDRELLQLYENENETLQQRIEDADALIEIADSERQDLQRARETLESENFALRARIDALVAERRTRPAIVEDLPTDLEGFREWCVSHLSGQVEVVPRAFSAVKKSEYHDPRLFYQALLLLRDRYVPMKRDGGKDLKSAFDADAAKLGLVDEPTFTGGGARWGEEKDAYVVQFRGREQLLDRHLKKGNDREARFCFRLYFFWDEETQQVVVGWLPSHLRTRAS